MTQAGSTLIQRFTRNPHGRDLLIGDIHGQFDKVAAGLKSVGFDPAFDRVFALGDLVDRGPQSEECLEWLAHPWFHSVRGNHEQMCIDDDLYMHVRNGGGWFRSMPMTSRLPYVEAFEALPLLIELETEAGLLGLVHADDGGCGWPRLVELVGQPDCHPGVFMNCIWGRTRITHMVDEPIAGVRAVVLGHTPVERVTSLGNAFYIDTGAWRDDCGAKPFAIVDAATLELARHPEHTLQWDPA